MNLLLVTPFFDPQTGGVATYVEDLARCLSRRGRRAPRRHRERDNDALRVVFYADAERRRRLLEPLAVCVDLDRDLGYDRLADVLSEALASCRTGNIPGTTNRPGSSGSFLVPSASHRPRLRIRLARWMARKSAALC
jgi:hypothetical protein